MGKMEVHTEPCLAEVEDDAVHVKGPEGMEVALSPKAALETARQLENAAVEAIVSHANSGAGTM